jgi:hypothetical protein
MKLKTDKIVLKKQLFDGYTAYYKADTLHKFASNIKNLICHGDISTTIDKYIVITPVMKEQPLEVEYIEKANRLVIDTLY